MDIVVDDGPAIELKTDDGILPVHEAQPSICPKLSGSRAGVLLNLNAAVLGDGVRGLGMRMPISAILLCASEPPWCNKTPPCQSVQTSNRS
jgi:hypothetical protein